MIYLSTCFMKAEIFAFRYEGLKTPSSLGVTGGRKCLPHPCGQRTVRGQRRGILTCVDALTGELHWQSDWMANSVHLRPTPEDSSTFPTRPE